MAAPKEIKPRVRKIGKADARAYSAKASEVLAKPALTPAELEQTIADLKSVVRFLSDWQRFTA